GSCAGIHQIVDDQPAFAITLYTLEYPVLSLGPVVIACHADGIDQADFEFPRDDRRRHQPAPDDGNDSIVGAIRHEAPGQGLGVAMQFPPGYGKGLVGVACLQKAILPLSGLRGGALNPKAACWAMPTVAGTPRPAGDWIEGKKQDAGGAA